MSPVRLYHIFPHYLINYTIFGKRLLNIKYVLRSSLQILSAAVLILRRPSAAWSHMFIGLHVRYPLFLRYFNATGIFSADFRKILKYQISWISVGWDISRVVPRWRTDRQRWRSWTRPLKYCNNENLIGNTGRQMAQNFSDHTRIRTAGVRVTERPLQFDKRYWNRIVILAVIFVSSCRHLSYAIEGGTWRHEEVWRGWCTYSSVKRQFAFTLDSVASLDFATDTGRRWILVVTSW